MPVTPSGQAVTEESKPIDLSLLKNKVVAADVSAFLPPGYKPEKEKSVDSSKLLEELLSKVAIQDPKALLPPDYKEKINQDNSTSILPLDYDPVTNRSMQKSDISSLLPPDYPSSVKSEQKIKSTTEASNNVGNLFKNASPVDISAFLPKGFKLTEAPSTVKTTTTTTKKPNNLSNLFNDASPLDISSFLPKDYKPDAASGSKPKVMNSPEGKPNKTKSITDLIEEAQPDDLAKFLPADFKRRFSTSKPKSTLATTTVAPAETPPPPASSSTSSPSNSFKVVFPSRPGQNKKTVRSTTTARAVHIDAPSNTPPTILKSWPSRLVDYH